MLESVASLSSSFRDPAGFLFHQNGELYRQINPSYLDEYHFFKRSGLYDTLIQAKALIPHEEIGGVTTTGLIIKPIKVPFISYPYEWSFSALKDAALLTLEIQKMALDAGMTLKDASCYNVQFMNGRPIFIDTLSFARYEDGSPWIAYRQFCQHFLAPLMLMRYQDIRLNQLLKIYIDGIPLDLASRLLPFSTRFKLSPALHIHAHAKLQKRYQAEQSTSGKRHSMPLATAKRFIDSLIHAVKGLTWSVQEDSEWHDYYIDNNNYSHDALSEKERIIHNWIQSLEPKLLWDLGANTGRFSSIVSPFCQQVIAWDIDTSCVERAYLLQRQHPSNILPLTLDLTNPSPAIGWHHHERASFMERGPANAILALGLIHHLAIVNNVPLENLARFFAQLCQHLVIEFIPKADSQVQKLLATREDVFPDYTQAAFEKAFNRFFTQIDVYPIQGSERTLYLFKNQHGSTNS